MDELAHAYAGQINVVKAYIAEDAVPFNSYVSKFS